MAAEVHIYQAELKDLGKAAALFNQYRQFYERDDDMLRAERYIKERLIRRDSVIYLADWKQHGLSVPAGFLQLYPTLSSLSMSKLWILNDLYVDAKYRGRGIGRKLLHQARMNAIQTGAKGLNLSTQHHNLAAQRLYESEGYVKDDEFIAYYLDL
ncbi:GNAT family N-acetyltransferase [Paenibacillus solani]|uniref:Acetyltransferase n=1 Tax=Paenibacillus solani TaxID=1705565 RepID=A0A0M1NKL5_9BACL|nr:GNAT family N-acetyltransferase [Paenibacillus solani]KOR82667.1 acetyltransferase [Paenibacillus solani]